MFLLEKLRSGGKRSWYYSKQAFSLFRSNWRPILIFGCVYVLVSYLIGSLLTFLIFLSYVIYNLYQICDNLLYAPLCPSDSRVRVPTPSSFGFHNFETHHILTEDNIRIHVMLLKVSKDAEVSPTLIYLHGNAGNIGHRLQNSIECLEKLKINILLVEYRGYGLSQGTPSEPGLIRDVLAALKFIENRNDLCSSKVILFGRSLGGAVAIGVTHMLLTSPRLLSYKPAAVIIENTFTSVPDIARHIMSNGRNDTYFKYLARCIPNWFYKSRYDSQRKIAQITLPTLFISGLADELIPFDDMNKLFSSSSASYKEMHKFESGTHNFTWRCTDYYPTMASFLSSVFNSSQFTEQRQVEPVDDEKSPLISCSVEFPPSSDTAPTLDKSVVRYHSQEATVSASEFENANYGDANRQVLQLLDSGFAPVVINMGRSKHSELVDI